MTRDIANLRPAAHYEDYARGFLEPWDALLVERLGALLAGRPPGVLLDIGTGTAVLPRKLARRPEFAGWRFLAIDSSADEVALARTQVAAEGLAGRIRVDVGDAHRLAPAYAALDCAISRATLHHLGDPVLALRQLHAALAPDGVGVIHDMRRDAAPAALALFARMRARAGYPPTRLAEKYTLAEARTLVAAAGLADVALVHSAPDGPGSLGFEIVLRRRAP